MSLETEDFAINLVTDSIKYFLANVIEQQLLSPNQIWEAYYYFFDEYKANTEGGCRLPGFIPNKEESVIGLALISALRTLEKRQCNATEVLEDEALAVVIGIQK